MAAVVDVWGRHKTKVSCRPWALPMVLGATLLLAGCGDVNRFQTAVPLAPATTAKPKSTFVQSPAAEKEHERILSSYGGAYDDPRLEALIGKTVDRLVAASDRPDQAHNGTNLTYGAGE